MSDYPKDNADTKQSGLGALQDQLKANCGQVSSKQINAVAGKSQSSQIHAPKTQKNTVLGKRANGIQQGSNEC